MRFVLAVRKVNPRLSRVERKEDHDQLRLMRVKNAGGLVAFC